LIFSKNSAILCRKDIEETGVFLAGSVSSYKWPDDKPMPTTRSSKMAIKW